MQLMQCGEITIAASCHATSTEQLPFYLPGSALIFVQSGTLHISTRAANFEIGAGSYGIIRKFTEGNMHKTFAPQEREANMFTFMLTNEFVERLVQQLELPNKVPPFTEEWQRIPATSELDIFMEEVIQMIGEGGEVDRERVVDQTFRALKAILNADEKAAVAFREYAKQEAADLLTFMNYNFMYNLPLELFARQSGRSLSSFNREFRKVFKETPRRWLMKKRLRFAFDQITAGFRPSDVYIQSGFEDLGHFSKAFKKEFGIVPSLVKRSTEKMDQPVSMT